MFFCSFTDATKSLTTSPYGRDDIYGFPLSKKATQISIINNIKSKSHKIAYIKIFKEMFFSLVLTLNLYVLSYFVLKIPIKTCYSIIS